MEFAIDFADSTNLQNVKNLVEHENGNVIVKPLTLLFMFSVKATGHICPFVVGLFNANQ